MSFSTGGSASAGLTDPRGSRVRSRLGRARRKARTTGRRTTGFAKVTPYLFVLLPVGLLLLLTYLPAANMVWYSFTSWNGFGAGPTPDEFVGLDNYVKVFTDPSIFQVFFVSLYYLAGAFVQMALALYFATLLSFTTRFSNFFRGILFFPYLLNGVAIGFVFLYLFQPDGTLDTVLGWFGIDETPLWLGDAAVANYSLAGTSVWRYVGLNFVLFLGAIQSIPPDLYEAAELDGANRWAQFRFIIVPGIKRIIGLSFILAIAGSLSVFEIPYIMTTGANGTKTFVIATIQTGFHFNKVGLASAMAVVLLLIVLLVTWIQRRVVPDEKVDLA